MPIDLYYTPPSPPSRTVLMTAYLAGVDVNLKNIDLLGGGQFDPDFKKINPRSKVPAINDNGFCLSESQAICAYLVGQYAKNDHLYPEEAQQRARVDQILYFDASVLFPSLKLYTKVAHGAKQYDPQDQKEFDDGLTVLNTMLNGRTYAAGGNHLTVADLALVATTSSFHAVDEHVMDKYPNIKSWFKRCCSEIDKYEELSGSGAKVIGMWVTNALNKLKK